MSPTDQLSMMRLRMCIPSRSALENRSRDGSNEALFQPTVVPDTMAQILAPSSKIPAFLVIQSPSCTGRPETGMTNGSSQTKGLGILMGTSF